jgi:hypothetical protein
MAAASVNPQFFRANAPAQEDLQANNLSRHINGRQSINERLLADWRLRRKKAEGVRSR